MGFAEFKQIKSIEGKGELFSLFKSVNLSQVSISGMPAEQARAYIFMLERNHKLYPFVYFYFPELNKGRFFIYEEGSVEIKKEETVREEALNFVESMGFIMEEIDLAHLSSQEFRELKKTLPFYYEDLSQFKRFMEEIEGGSEEKEEEVEAEEIEVEIQEPEPDAGKIPADKKEGMGEIPEETRFIIKSLIDKYGLGRIPHIETRESEAVVVEVEDESEGEAEIIEVKKLPQNIKQIIAKFLSSG